jgi:hypothetical protein
MLALAVLAFAAAPLPAEIRAHYRDHNFVSAFSTPQERRLVAQGRQTTATERLKRVAEAMERLAADVADVDKGMAKSFGPGPLDGVLREDLLRVTSFEGDESTGQIWVYLESLRLDPPGQATLVGSYDELGAGGQERTVEELVAATGRAPVATFEIHRWRRVGGGWQRDRATQHFVGFQGRD